MYLTRKLIYGFIILCGISLNLSGCQALKHGWFSNTSIAIDGYDPVAYFHSHQTIDGSHEYSYQYANKIWYFSSEQNRLDFIARPHQYIPQYHGYSAYDMAHGDVKSADPHIWEIVNKKLYLNRNATVHHQWLQNRYHYIHQANQQWRTYLHEQRSQHFTNNSSTPHSAAVYSPSPYYRDNELTGKDLQK